VTFVPGEGAFVVCWAADDDRFGLLQGEFEIFGQLFTTAPEFAITEIQLSGNSVIISFVSAENVLYSLHESTDLKTWTDSGAGEVSGTGGGDQLVDPNGAEATERRYFRVVR
jgi:hypothetical protein